MMVLTTKIQQAYMNVSVWV